MAKKSIDKDAGVVSFSFDEAGTCEINVADLSEEIKTQLILHGISQKVGDSYAGAKSAVAELDITADEWSRAQAADTIQQLIDGKWAVRASGGGARVTDLARALAEVAGAPVEDMVAKIDEATKEEKAALRKHPKVALVLSRFKQERAEAKQKELEAAAESAPSLGDLLG